MSNLTGSLFFRQNKILDIKSMKMAEDENKIAGLIIKSSSLSDPMFDCKSSWSMNSGLLKITINQGKKDPIVYSLLKLQCYVFNSIEHVFNSGLENCWMVLLDKEKRNNAGFVVAGML